MIAARNCMLFRECLDEDPRATSPWPYAGKDALHDLPDASAVPGGLCWGRARRAPRRREGSPACVSPTTPSEPPRLHRAPGPVEFRYYTSHFTPLYMSRGAARPMRVARLASLAARCAASSPAFRRSRRAPRGPWRTRVQPAHAQLRPFRPGRTTISAPRSGWPGPRRPASRGRRRDGPFVQRPRPFMIVQFLPADDGRDRQSRSAPVSPLQGASRATAPSIIQTRVEHDCNYNEFACAGSAVSARQIWLSQSRFISLRYSP